MCGDCGSYRGKPCLARMGHKGRGYIWDAFPLLASAIVEYEGIVDLFRLSGWVKGLSRGVALA